METIATGKLQTYLEFTDLNPTTETDMTKRKTNKQAKIESAEEALAAVAKQYNLTPEQVLASIDEAVVAVIRANHTVH